MSGDAATFLVQLREQISAPAKTAAGALQNLQGQIKGSFGDLGQLEGKLGAASAKLKGLAEGSAAYKKQKDAVAELQNQIASKNSELGRMGQQLEPLQKSAGALEEFGARVPLLGAVTSKLREMGPMGEAAAGGIEKMVTKLGAAAGPIGMAIAGVAALTVVLGGAFLAMAKFAFANANAKRSQLINLEAITGTAAGAKELDDIFGRVAKTSSLAGDRIDEMGKALAVAGLRGPTLEGALKSLATVEATVGQAGADKLREIIDKAGASGKFVVGGEALAKTGITQQELYAQIAKKTGKGIEQVEGLMKAGKVSIEDGVAALNAAVQGKFGDLAGKQLLDFDVQMRKLHDNVGALFEDADTGPFLAGLSDALSVLDESSASGKALKGILSSVFGGFFEVAGAAFGPIKMFMKELVILALKLYLEFKPIGQIISSAFKTPGGGGGVAVFMKVLVTIIGAVVRTFLAALAAVLLLVAGVVLFGKAVAKAFGGAADWLSDSFMSAIAMVVDAWVSLSSLDVASIGRHMIRGLVEGIFGGGPDVTAAITSAVGGAINAAKSMLGIASPSKVFEGLGAYTAEGMAQGIDAGAADVNKSVESMVKPPAMADAGAGGGRGGGGKAIHIDKIEVAINNPKNAEEARQGVLQGIAQAFEMLANQMGAPA